MEHFGKKGTFVGYSETFEAYHIYIHSQRHIEVGCDVIFHEEYAFKRSKEFPYDIDTKEHDTSMLEFPKIDSTHPNFQRENPTELLFIDEPPTKRRYAWC